LSCFISFECTQGFLWRVPEQADTVSCRASHPHTQSDQVLCTLIDSLHSFLTSSLAPHRAVRPPSPPPSTNRLGLLSSGGGLVGQVGSGVGGVSADEIK